MNRYELTRTVSMTECPWLKEDMMSGFEVYEYIGKGREACRPGFIYVTIEIGGLVPIMLPKNALLEC